MPKSETNTKLKLGSLYLGMQLLQLAWIRLGVKERNGNNSDPRWI